MCYRIVGLLYIIFAIFLKIKDLEYFHSLVMLKEKTIYFDVNIEMFHDTPLLRMSDFSILIYNFS